jgi:hypothetical protein
MFFVSCSMFMYCLSFLEIQLTLFCSGIDNVFNVKIIFSPFLYRL